MDLQENFLNIQDSQLVSYWGPGGAVSIPEGVTSIFCTAFNFGGGVTSLHLPKSMQDLTLIGSGLRTLQEITVEEGNPYFRSVDGMLLRGDTLLFCPPGRSEVVIPPVREIEEGAFSWVRDHMRSVYVPDTFEVIQECVFFACSALETVVLPPNLEEIEREAFGKCTSLSKIVLPDSLLHIGDGAFQGCTSLTSIFLPKGVEQIDSHVFRGCSALAEIIVEAENPRYHSTDGILYDREDVLCCPKGKRGPVRVENGTKKIAWHAFHGCGKVTEVDFPDSVSSIGTWAFGDCTSLRRLVLPPKLKKISANLANGCTGLEEVVFPASLTEIGKHAFQSNGLRAVDLPDGVSVARSSFEFCNALEEVTVTGAADLPVGCFGSCPLKRLTIRGAEAKIAPSAFSCDALEEFRADEMPFSAFPKGPMRETAIRFFCKRFLAGEEVFDQGSYLKYMKSQRKKLYALAVAQPEVLRVMFAENLLTGKEIQPLLDEADRTGNVTAKAAILEYSQGLTPTDPIAEMEEELAKADRLDAYIEKHGTLPVSELKKIWSYEKNKDGTLTITSYKGKTGPEVTVPAKIGKSLVTKIDMFAFGFGCCSEPILAARLALTSVTIPEGVTEIGRDAFNPFYNSSSLTCVTLPASVTRFGLDAFANCPKLTIRAPAGSHAERYAKRNKIPFEPI